ncbi:hypothetical protein GCM10022225_52050 [Plantactinospora mayteni]|uniref:Uncharacterized protein n=1 Tax=Plantactinospora mayteni TaxID=566021 RepID=A0ABQ4EYZ6_9ACTN|nr:hypothetical protein Pma05_64510 [Plantactinospora mayteni]
MPPSAAPTATPRQGGTEASSRSSAVDQDTRELAESLSVGRPPGSGRRAVSTAWRPPITARRRARTRPTGQPTSTAAPARQAPANHQAVTAYPG